MSEAAPLPNTAVFLAGLWRDIDAWYMEGLALEGDALRAHYTMKFPILQGIANQTRVRKLAALPCATGQIAAEIDRAIL